MSRSTSTAAVWRGPEQGFALEDVPLPTLAPGEVLVRTRLATLCGSDLHTVAGERSTPLPTVLGHEMVGDVLATGGGVRTTTGEPVGDGMRITWSVGASCGECARCRRGLPQKCTHLEKYGHAAMTDHWRLSGGLASHCHLLPGTGIVALPDAVDDRIATPANCATATIVSAVRNATPEPGQTVVVQGCGMLGLTAVSYLRSLGIDTVIASDLDAERRELAEQAGALAVPPEGLAAAVREQTGGEGAEVVLDLTGNSAAVQTALDELLAIGGRLVLVGSVFPAPAIALDPEAAVRRLLSVTGVHNYRPEDLMIAVAFLASLGRAEAALFHAFVPRVFDLDQIDQAIAYATTTRAPRVAVDPTKGP